MDLQALDQVLTISNGQLTVTSSLFPGTPLDSLLTIYNGNSPLIIDGATKAPQGTNAITVQGKASFQGVADLPVTGVFSLDASNNPVCLFRFTLIPAATGVTWRFSTSYPDLPPFQPADVIGGSVLNQFVFSEAAFVLSTAAASDPVTAKPIALGLNFIGTCRPTGVLGLIETTLAPDQDLILYGTIQPPVVGHATLPLPVETMPWDRLSWPVPGIQLTIDLEISFSLNNLSFREAKAHIYSPVTKAWLSTNGSYQPVMALTGSLLLPKANQLRIDLVTEIAPGLNSLLLQGKFSGFSLQNLESLADIAPSSQLSASLPADLQSALKTLNTLSLLSMAISLEGGLSGASVSFISLKIGLPNLNWTIFTDFKVQSLTCEFFVYQPFASTGTSVGATMGGVLSLAGVALDIFTQMPDFSVRADLPDGATLPIKNFFSTYLKELPAPPDLNVDALQVYVKPGQSYFLTCSMADTKPWNLSLGPVGLSISDVSLTLSKSQGQSAGSFAGTIVLNDDLELSCGYDMPGSFYVRAELPGLKLSDLIQIFDRKGITLPAGFDVDLQQSYVLITDTSGTLTFTAATLVSGLGLLGFTVAGQGNNTGVAFGISLNDSSPSKIAGLSQLGALESFLGLQSLMLVVSSLDMPGFEFPDMAHFNAPQIAGTKLTLPRQASGLVRGLNLYAQFTTSNDRGLGALLKYLGIKADGSIGITLAVSLPSPSTNSKLFLSVNEKINNVTSIAGELGVMLQSSQAAVFLLATVNTRLQGQPAQFSVSAMVVANGIFISGTMVGSLTFGGVTLSNVALVIGIDFEGIPSLGFAATLTVKTFQSSLAIFFDSTDPGRSMLAGAVSELSLKDVLDAFAGKVIPSAVDDVLSKIELVGTSSFTIGADLAAALDNRQLDKISAAFAQNHVPLPTQSSQVLLVRGKAGSYWFITDMTTMLHYELVKAGDGIHVSLEPQFYLIPQPTAIGALKFDQGTFINTGLQILTLNAMAKVLVMPSQGISVDGSMSRIVIGTENLFSVESADGKSGPRVSAATFSQPAMKDPALQAPHFLIDGQLSLLGIKRQTYISISSKGFIVNIAGTLVPGATYTINGSFTGLTDLEVGGSLHMALDPIDLGTLGKIKIDGEASGALKAGVHGASIFANCNAEVRWAGQKFPLPTINLDVKRSTLQALPKLVFDQATDALRTFLQDANRWAFFVHQGLIFGATDVGKVLSSFYDKSAQETAQILHTAGYTASQTVGYLKSAYGASVDQAAQWLKGAGYTVIQVGDALRSAWTVSDTAMASALKGAGYAVDQAGGYVKDAYHLGSNDLKRALEGAGYATSQVKGFFNSLGGSFADAFKSVGDAINPTKWFS